MFKRTIDNKIKIVYPLFIPYIFLLISFLRLLYIIFSPILNSYFNDIKNSKPTIIIGMASSGINKINPIIIIGIPIIAPIPVNDIIKPINIANMPAILVFPLSRSIIYYIVYT